MRHTSFDHPPLDVLERFALNGCSEQELELVEEHILACESCVTALEAIELEIAAKKLALAPLLIKEKPEPERKTGRWTKWFSVPTLSWAGAGLAACAFCLFAFLPANILLTAERGSAAAAVVPEWRSAHLTLVNQELPSGPIRAEIVTQTGSLIWAGEATVTNGEVRLSLQRMRAAGLFYARLYSAGTEHELLSEFPFEVKWQF